ncbi:MAG: class I SAM-dependent methyltransferase [Pirellulales bacterium]
MPQTDIPDWRLPPGVGRSLWEYAQTGHIADDYDEYFSHNSLFTFDEAVLRKHFTRPGTIVDLGAGTGRLLVPFARDGFDGLAVDLSLPMLRVVRQKAAREQLPIDMLLANMAELDCLRDGVADYCISMFSTLGMVRGRDNRRRVLAHARRILKPGGLLVVHVHNRWYNLFVPGGAAWLARNGLAALFRRDIEPGDKIYDYRGIPGMYLHLFTRGELARELRKAGFRIREFLPLDTERRHALPHPWLLGRLRANGWIVVCEKPT